MRINYLAGVILSVTSILSACGGGEPTTCTISTTKDLRQGVTKTAKFAGGTDCEAMRLLAEQGQPLPTVGTDAISTSAPKIAATRAPEAFSAPFVSGQKGQELIATTNKQARVQELERKMGVDGKQSRDPFTSTIINPVPRLETLLAKPKQQPDLRAAVVVRTSTRPVFIAPPPPIPPDTKAAEGRKITGTVEVSGTVYVILTAFGEPTSRYVRAGQLVSNGRVLVKRIDTNAEPPIVVLQQNGVEVFRAVGQQVVASTDTTTAAAPTAPTTVQPTTPPLSIPFLVPAQ